jgi:hypothetical protein
MTGATTPCPAETGLQALPCRSALPGLEAIIKQRWNEVAPSPDPRLRGTRPVELDLPQSLASQLQIFAPAESGLTTFLERLEVALRAPIPSPDAFGEDDELDADMPLGLAPIGAPQACMQALLQDFSRRQRHATMLVAGCVTASSILTVVGVVALATIAGPPAGRSESPSPGHLNSLAWQRTSADTPGVVPISASPDRSAKGDSLFVPARLDAAESAAAPIVLPAVQRASGPELILMQPGRSLSLAPLIEPRRASYVLIRGLPDDAKLSAGQRSPSGAWLVKASDIGSLTMSIGGDVSGDCTAEIYALGVGSPSRGRQRLVFRVEPGFGRMATDGFNWAATLRDMAMTSEAVSTSTETPTAHLTDEGDAAEADLPYERTSEAGDAESKERMKILASLSG